MFRFLVTGVLFDGGYVDFTLSVNSTSVFLNAEHLVALEDLFRETLTQIKQSATKITHFGPVKPIVFAYVEDTLAMVAFPSSFLLLIEDAVEDVLSLFIN